MSVFKTYLKSLLAKKHEGMKMAEAAAARIDEVLVDLAHNLAADAIVYSGISKRKTIMSKDVEVAMTKTLTPEAAAPAIARAAEAIEAYRAETKGSRSIRAGLVLPVSRVETILRSVGEGMRLGEDVGVYVAAVLERVALDLLGAIGDVVVADKKKIVAVAHVERALETFEPSEWTTTFLKVARTGQQPEPLGAEETNEPSV